MKKLMVILFVMVLSFISACMADEIPEEAISQLKEHCYINPAGGSKLHADQNCQSVNPRYLPLTEIEFSDKLLNQYSICPVCTIVEQPQEEPSPLDMATKVMSEEEIYRITERMMERAGDRIFLMLCTIIDSKGNPMLSGTRLEDLSERLKEAIVTSVRYTDTVTRYGKGQYLILLINTSFDDCSIVAKRINSN